MYSIENENIMHDENRTKEDLVKELQELRKEYDAIKISYEKDITDRKKAEESLRESEEKYAKAFQTSPYAIIITHVEDGKFIDVNDAFTTITGFTLEEAISNSSIGLKLWVNIEDRKSVVSALLEGKEVKEKEFQFRKKNDEIILGLFAAQIVYFNGTPFIFSSINDITENKQAEDALRQKEAIYRNLLERMPDGVYKSTHAGKFVDANTAMVKMLSYMNKEELMGIDILTQLYFEPADRESLVLQENLEEMGVYRLKKKDGSAIWVEDHGWYTMDEKKEILFHEGVLRDVTDRKKAEDRLLESEEWYRIFINATRYMVFLKDDKRKYLLVNEALAKFFGTEKGEIIGKSDFEMMSEEAAQNCHVTDELALKSDSVVVGEEPVGDKIYETYKFRVPFSNGRFGIGGYIRDVTERREKEQQLINQTKQLRELNATKDKFFSIIAHDLRSPFQPLLGFTRMLVEDLPSLRLDEIQKMALSMRSAANKLFNLLENLLEWSRTQRGIITFDPETFLLMPRLTKSMVLAFEAITSKEIDLSYDVSEELTVFADCNMFESIIRNLVSNAIKFNAPKGKIAITAKLMDINWVEISVKDTGIGISQEMVSKLFQQDVNTSRKGNDEEPSAGLGLIICKDFIEKHSGKLWVESVEGEGSTFYFTLPTKSGYNKA